jgi:hypothetical protein
VNAGLSGVTRQSSLCTWGSAFGCLKPANICGACATLSRLLKERDWHPQYPMLGCYLMRGSAAQTVPRTVHAAACCHPPLAAACFGMPACCSYGLHNRGDLWEDAKDQIQAIAIDLLGLAGNAMTWITPLGSYLAQHTAMNICKLYQDPRTTWVRRRRLAWMDGVCCRARRDASALVPIIGNAY